MPVLGRFPLIWQCPECRRPVTLDLDAHYADDGTVELVKADLPLRAHMAQHRDD